ncbi:MAG: Gfo/Idh/MocA family oxidoreductase [Verrucomicrobia bacterium]|nr:Gfo/Idh/MocA family oxidoreductase [Verrucomicrobiota bacterium]
MEKVRLGIIGVGAMGEVHAQNILNGKVPRCELAAICDRHPERLQRFASIPGFVSVDELLASSATDAVLIATPHYSHTAIGIQALNSGKHVLVEKPISVHKADAERLLAAHTRSDQVFGAMFNQRTDPFFLKLRQLVQSGELGPVRRVHWTITDWFRTEAYYQSSAWRATWAGEGGGVLLNQCPHNLDLYQWIFGMPSSVRAFCHFGRYHDIEVEDDVTAYLEYPDRMTAVINASTGEAPGTNRLEVAAERGKVVIENDQFLFTRNEVPMSEFSRTDPGRFSAPATWDVRIPVRGHGPQHDGVLANFVAAILDGASLIAPAREGILSLELANAFLLSTLENRSVQLPLDGTLFEQHLQRLIASSSQQKPKVVRPAVDDMASSFR